VLCHSRESGNPFLLFLKSKDKMDSRFRGNDIINHISHASICAGTFVFWTAVVSGVTGFELPEHAEMARTIGTNITNVLMDFKKSMAFSWT